MPTFVRVRDAITGHQYDVDVRAIRHGQSPVNRRHAPELSGPGARPRPAKHKTDMTGSPVATRTE